MGMSTTKLGLGPLIGSVFDEPVVAQPLDGSALGSNITQGVPRRDQFEVVLIELIVESSERSSSSQCVAQALADFAVADALGEVGHVPKPHGRRNRGQARVSN